MNSKNPLPGPSKGAIRKSILRNVEVPIRTSDKQGKVVKHPVAPAICKDPQYKNLKLTNKTESNNYSIPKLNTALSVAKKIEEVKNKKLEALISGAGDLTPRSKAIVAHEVTKHLNFDPDKQVFKGLIPLNVNDSVLIPEKRQPFRKKYVPKGNKDPVPDLADWITPIEPLKHTIPLYDKPDVLRKPYIDNFKEISELLKKYDDF